MPAALRYHPGLPYRHNDGTFTYHPAMIARVDDANGYIATLHRTYLTVDGHKAAVSSVKRLMPCPRYGATKGGAVRLFPAGETLAVSEGIETALAIYVMTKSPCWAAVSATGLSQFTPPDEPKLVCICADNDAAGVQAAKELTPRLQAYGKRVKVLIPDEPGSDWADDLRKETPSA
jgi:putative DNA primase/helicase